MSRKTLHLSRNIYSTLVSRTNAFQKYHSMSTQDGLHPPTTIEEIPKTWSFTSNLPPDPLYPTPKSSHETERRKLGPRTVKSALYTFVRPAPTQDPQLLATSAAALHDLNIESSSSKSPGFLSVVSGNTVLGYDESDSSSKAYPWAQCYGGYQFGSW